MIVSSGEVRASHTSFSVMAPMAASNTRTRTSSCLSFSNSLRIASIEPRKSALRITFSSAIFRSVKFSKLKGARLTSEASCCFDLRFSAISRATAKSGST